MSNIVEEEVGEEELGDDIDLPCQLESIFGELFGLTKNACCMCVCAWWSRNDVQDMVNMSVDTYQRC